MKKYFYILFIFFIAACSSSDQQEKLPVDNYDRGQLLTSICDEMIIPAYDEMYTNMDTLKSSVITFTNSPNQSTLNKLRNAWVDAYFSWQNVALFNTDFPAELNLSERINTYPTSEQTINAFMNDTVLDLTAPNYFNYQSTGFPAMGYLIYGLGGDSNSVLLNYTDINTSFVCKSYLNVVVENMFSNIESVKNYWQQNRGMFISASGNSNTSSLNIIINGYLEYYEKRFRNGKIEIPSGARGESPPSSISVESYYRPDLCKDLCVEAYNAIQRFYKGISFDGESVIGIENYLQYFDDTESLRQAINDQFVLIEQSINELDNNFIYQIENDNIKMEQAFLAIQDMVRYLKTDVLSKLNISRLYFDGDND